MWVCELEFRGSDVRIKFDGRRGDKVGHIGMLGEGRADGMSQVSSAGKGQAAFALGRCL